METNILVAICILMVIIICIYINAANAANAVNTTSLVDPIESAQNYDIMEIHENSTIIDHLKIISKKYPEKIALKQKDKSKNWRDITYKEYYKNVENFASAIRNLIGSNINTAIMGFNSPGWFYSHLGCMMNGGVSVGLYTTFSKKTCEYIFENTNIRLLVVEDNEQLEKFIDCNLGKIEMIVYYAPINPKLIKKFQVPLISIGTLSKLTKITNFPLMSDIATIIYTSGTTGMPKGVMISHENIMLNLRSIIKMTELKSSIKFNANEQFISYLPLNHITGQMMDIYLPIGLTGTVWFANKNALKSSLCKTLIEVNPTVCVGVPRVWEKIVESIESDGIKSTALSTLMPYYIIKQIGLEKCKFAINVAAPISEHASNFMESIGVPIYDIYGMSETTGPISISIPSLYKKGSVGMPIMKIRIQKKHQDDLAGEILVKGKNLFVGYCNNKNAYKSTFKGDWFQTGDIGYLDDEGYLFVTGRLKDIIITSGGENISPIPIENKLKEKLGKYFANIMVIGNKRKFLSLLLNESVQKCDSRTIQSAIDAVNLMVDSNASKIKKWKIIKHDFVIGNELSPTLKLCREYIIKKYSAEIDKLY